MVQQPITLSMSAKTSRNSGFSGALSSDSGPHSNWCMSGIGTGLGAGAITGPESDAWGAALAESPGELIAVAFGGLGRFGSFCAVVLALGTIGATVAVTYSAALGAQALFTPLQRIPRIAWITISVILMVICAAVGRSKINEIITNLVAITGYWVSAWLAIFIEEYFFF